MEASRKSGHRRDHPLFGEFTEISKVSLPQMAAFCSSFERPSTVFIYLLFFGLGFLQSGAMWLSPSSHFLYARPCFMNSLRRSLHNGKPACLRYKPVFCMSSFTYTNNRVRLDLEMTCQGFGKASPGPIS